jgi:SHS2 domain-containing protein
MPFEEVFHTADWCLRVWSADLAGLFSESAIGMNALAGVRLAEGPRARRTFETAELDPESMLVAFLSELLNAAELERLGFDLFRIDVQGQTLKVEMEGAPLLSFNNAIKAVTYHNLQIQETARGVEVEIVFDV